MIKPDYNGGSIVNLISTLYDNFGSNHSYPVLEKDKHFDINRDVILLIIDGLGYNFFTQRCKEAQIYKHLHCKLTTVFPSTTAAAMTCFYLGYPVQQHALTGWFFYLKEFGCALKSIPFSTISGDIDMSKWSSFEEITGLSPKYSLLDVSTYLIQPFNFKDSSYTQYVSIGAKVLFFKSMSDMFNKLELIRKIKTKKRKFLIAYWTGFDAISHQHGPSHSKALEHIKKLSNKVLEFLNSSKETNFTLIVTSDHGFLDTPSESLIRLENHPELDECLSHPLCGEARLAYCYVRHGYAKKFINYINSKLDKYCECRESKKLVSENYFGLGKPNPKIEHRIGDFVLIMKKNYIIRGKLMGEEQKILKGNHGGVSPDEMYVPLLIFNPY